VIVRLSWLALMGCLAAASAGAAQLFAQDPRLVGIRDLDRAAGDLLAALTRGHAAASPGGVLAEVRKAATLTDNLRDSYDPMLSLSLESDIAELESAWGRATALCPKHVSGREGKAWRAVGSAMAQLTEAQQFWEQSPWRPPGTPEEESALAVAETTSLTKAFRQALETNGGSAAAAELARSLETEAADLERAVRRDASEDEQHEVLTAMIDRMHALESLGMGSAPDDVLREWKDLKMSFWRLVDLRGLLAEASVTTRQ
jgi:hypothetical protein